MWKRRNKKKPFIFSKKFSPIILIPLILVIFFLVFKTGVFTIKVVEVESSGLGCVDNNQLKDNSGLVGKNFFAPDQTKLDKELKEKFVCVKNISISRVFPGKINMKVTGRQPAAVLVSLKEKLASVSSLTQPVATPSAGDISANFVVDDEGVVFAGEAENQNIPKVFIYNLNLSLGDKLKSDIVDSYLKILDRVKIFGLTVKDSWVNGDYFIVNPHVPGPKIIFRLDDEIDIQLASLQLILDKAKIDSSELEFIDLRFDKPVVRFAPKR